MKSLRHIRLRLGTKPVMNRSNGVSRRLPIIVVVPISAAENGKKVIRPEQRSEC